MKTKPKEPPKTTEAIVTSTARLTIQGQTFEMPLSELEDLYGKIGTALGKKHPNMADEYRKIIDRLPKLDHLDPHYIPPINKPFPMRPPYCPPEIFCKANSVVVDGIQAGKHSDQRDRF